MEKYAIVIAGPSGAGKTTVADYLIEKLGNLEMSRSATTRERRGDGRDDEYVYISVDEFKSSIENGDVVEHTEYSGNFYGTRKCELDRILDMGKYPILVLDYNGARSLKERLDYPAYAFYVYTSLAEAEKRLNARDAEIKSDSEELSAKKKATLEKRKAENKRDYAKLHEIAELFDFYAENDTVESCADEIIRALSLLKSGISPMSAEKKHKITADFLSQI